MSKMLKKEVGLLRQKDKEKDRQIAQLKTSLQQTESKLQHAIEEYETLRQSFLNTQRLAFGKKSERFVDDSPAQRSLFESDSLDDAQQQEADSDTHTETISYTRTKKKSNAPNLDLLPQRDEIIPVDDAARTCECGREKEIIRYETKRILNYQPAIFEVVTQKREIVACRKGCDKSVVTAPAPTHILPKCRASHSLLAHIAISKVLDRQPLYHLEHKIEREHGWRIPRQTMARWMIQLSEKLQALINLMKDEIIGYDIGYIDATSLQVLHEPGRLAETKSYAYCIRGGPPDKQVTLYEYNGHYKKGIYSHKQFVTDTLAGFEGVLHCDGADTCDGIAEKSNVTLSYCHAHARRKFEAIEKQRRSGKKKGRPKPGLAAHVLKNVYQPLYDIERDMKANNLTPTQRSAYREEYSRPILKQWHTWLTAHEPITLKHSPIGKAIRYALTHWKGLQVYLADGRIEIDNNATERDIKPFVMARKNFLFACTQAGADSLGVHFSLIVTAKHHGLDPARYYHAIFDRLPLCKTIADYEKLLPWNISF